MPETCKNLSFVVFFRFLSSKSAIFKLFFNPIFSWNQFIFSPFSDNVSFKISHCLYSRNRLFKKISISRWKSWFSAKNSLNFNHFQKFYKNLSFGVIFRFFCSKSLILNKLFAVFLVVIDFFSHFHLKWIATRKTTKSWFKIDDFEQKNRKMTTKLRFL